MRILNSFYDKFIFTNGLKYVHNNFYLENVPFVMIPTEILAGLWSGMDEDLVKQAYYSVKRTAEFRVARRFDEDFGLKDEKLVQFVLSYLTASGWGLLQIQNIDFANKRALATVFDNPFLEASADRKNHSDKLGWGGLPERLLGVDTQRRAPAPSDPLLRGTFAGLFSHVFKTDVDCVEIFEDAMQKSFAKFVIKPAREFDWASEEVRAQINPPL